MQQFTETLCIRCYEMQFFQENFAKYCDETQEKQKDNTMKYTLKNKDKVVLEFEVETIVEKGDGTFQSKTTYQTLTDVAVFEKSLLPLTLGKEDIKNKLQTWLGNRKTPKNRAFVEKIVATYGGNDRNFMDYIDVSLGLSLNDSYWIVPSDKDYKWKDYNLYDNEFDKALELVAFMGASNKVSGITSSPEYTTNGMLKKCWHRENGQIYLYKGQGEKYANGGREAYAEYFSSQLARFLGFNAITYDLKLFHNQLVSTCPIFTNENEGYVPIYYCIDRKKSEHKNVEAEREIMRVYGKEAFEDLMVFDSLIANQDRHLGNFGMIVDNNTGEILRPAPIFDNGASIFNTICENDFNNIEKSISEQRSYFGYSFNEQLERFFQDRHIKNIEKLQHFHFKQHHQFSFNQEWLNEVENYLHCRANEILCKI